MNPDDAIRGAAEEIARNMWGCQRKDRSCNPDCERYGECRDCVEECNAVLTRRLSPLLAAKDKRIAELAEEVARLRYKLRLSSGNWFQEKEREHQEHMQRVNEQIEQGCRRTKGDVVLPE